MGAAAAAAGRSVASARRGAVGPAAQSAALLFCFLASVLHAASPRWRRGQKKNIRAVQTPSSLGFESYLWIARWQRKRFAARASVCTVLQTSGEQLLHRELTSSPRAQRRDAPVTSNQPELRTSVAAMSALEARAAQHRTSARLELHQERRRKEALKRQKDARSDRSNRFRALEPEAPIQINEQLTKAQRKKQRAFDDARQRSERWSGELCSYDWLCDIPANLNGTNTSEGWFCLP